MQRDESGDGRHSLESCCPEDLSVRCRLLRESDPRTRGPQSPGAQSGFPDGAGVRGGGGWPTCPLFGVGRRCSSWEAVADMPVAVPQFVKVVDDPVVQVVAGVCPVLGQGG